MLSILIPIYNYDVTTLVKELHRQSNEVNIEYEIICLDDGSNSPTNNVNEEINKLKNCTFKANTQNIGRSSIRNLLAEKAIYNHLLFIDADTIPKSKNYISNYITQIGKGYDVILGGFFYDKIRPDNNAILRWKYGKSREEIDETIRNKEPYKVIISGNMFITKEVFLKTNSNMLFNNYGLDNYFGALLKQTKIKILHLNNEVYHLGLEKSSIFLNKTEQAVKTLMKLSNEEKFSQHSNDLLKWYTFFKKSKLVYLMYVIHLTISPLIKKNLLGKKPSIFLLQVYKLTIMCYYSLKV
ncbi:glycosyltransferase family 2 protein [Seonamhaeicola marinus]|uniref:Glycosyltransferase family 2 protein n=1 Tax=Seonamhaeicola marinus TaxID=1912246 RepID=A0A5D0IVG2_9FLAO|nr:glycosyltransferase [Seonamhaeicola marinus]TYA86790.1 glycosyltransferase family 2 protein [Seonamhaeicola marinus]